MNPDSIVSGEEFGGVYVFISNYIPLGSIFWRSSIPTALGPMWDIVGVESVGSQESVSSASVELATPAIHPDGIISGESVGTITLIASALASPDSVDSSEFVSSPQFDQIIHPDSAANESVVESPQLNSTVYADEISSSETFDGIFVLIDLLISDLTVDNEDVVSDVSVAFDATVVAVDSIFSREVVGDPTVGLCITVYVDSIDSSERVPRLYLHHPITDLTVECDEAVPDISVIDTVPPLYPLSILSSEMVNNTAMITDGVIYPYALNSDNPVGEPNLGISSVIGVSSLPDESGIGDVVASADGDEIDADNIASEENVSDEVLATDVFVAPKPLDFVYSDIPIDASKLYQEGEVTRTYNGTTYDWDTTQSYYYSTYAWVHEYVQYSHNRVPDDPDHPEGGWHYEPVTTDVTVLRESFEGFSYDIWKKLVYAHQLPWYLIDKAYYGQLEEWILHGLNVFRLMSEPTLGAITNALVGAWHVGNPIAELVQDSPGGTEVIQTNLGIVDDRIAELRGTSPAGIIANGVPQQVYATVSAVTAEVTDTFASIAEYTIEDKLANYEIYEDISVTPAFNYIFSVPEPTYIQGIPVLPALRTDHLCSIDIISTVLKIGKDSSGKTEFFGVAPDIYGETVTDYDLVDDLPPSLYNPQRPPVVRPEDPTSDWWEPDPYDIPDVPDGWDGWTPEETDSGDTGEDWEETPDGVTPSGSQTRYKDFPLNLFGGGTIILSGVPKYKNNGKKKWIFATGKKKKRKDDDECVDQEVDDGPRYIGAYFRNGHLVLTDGEYVLRTAAPPRGQRVFIFAGYYGKKSFIGWWKSPKKYKYRMGEMVDKGQSNKGVTTIMIGRAWGQMSPGENAGNGMTIGNIKVIDESGNIPEFGNDPNIGTPTSTLQGIAMSDLGYNDKVTDDSGTSEPYYLDPNNPNNKALQEIIDAIHEASNEIKVIEQNLRDYPNMPADKRAEGNAALTRLRDYVSQLRNDYSERAAVAPPHWVPVDQKDEDYLKYRADYNKWKLQARMIGYFSINDTSRVGVPGVH